MIRFDLFDRFVQFGFHGGRWNVETVWVEYEGEPEHVHLVYYLGPLCLSVEWFE